MKKFKQFIELKEDFNTGTQFPIFIGTKKIILFYEMKKGSFNLFYYLQTFFNRTALELMQSKSRTYRGGIFIKNSICYIFIWDAYYGVHYNIFKYLSNNYKEYPQINYLNYYENIQEELIYSNDILCFPFQFTNKLLFSDYWINDSSLKKMNKFYNIKDLFKINDDDWKRMLIPQDTFYFQYI